MFDPKLIDCRNSLDADGKPAGGSVVFNFRFSMNDKVHWQEGPLVVDGVPRQRNGAFVEDFIYAAKQRLEFFERVGFECDENKEAIAHLAAALQALADRQARRAAAGTAGTHEGK